VKNILEEKMANNNEEKRNRIEEIAKLEEKIYSNTKLMEKGNKNPELLIETAELILEVQKELSIELQKVEINDRNRRFLEIYREIGKLLNKI